MKRIIIPHICCTFIIGIPSVIEIVMINNIVVAGRTDMYAIKVIRDDCVLKEDIIV